MTQQTDIGLSNEQIELLRSREPVVITSDNARDVGVLEGLQLLYTTPLTDDRYPTPIARIFVATIDRIRSEERDSVSAEVDASLEAAAAIWDRSDVPHGRANARAIRLAAAISKTERTEG